MFALCSCASVLSKSDYPVTFNSSKPTKITVKKKSSQEVVYSGMAPTTVTLSASDGYFKAAKYSVQSSKKTTSVNAEMDPWYLGNVLAGGFIGAFIDPATGAMWKLPNQVSVD